MVKRSAIFWLEMEAEGRRPVCVLTRDEAIPALRNIVVATITSRERGVESELPLDRGDGLPKNCVISLDNLQTVPKAQLAEPITNLRAGKLAELCQALDRATGCD